MKVKCIKKDKDTWGKGSGNLEDLSVGTEYEVVKKDIHSWHTLYSLSGVNGTFNSVLFEESA